MGREKCISFKINKLYIIIIIDFLARKIEKLNDKHYRYLSAKDHRAQRLSETFNIGIYGSYICTHHI